MSSNKAIFESRDPVNGSNGAVASRKNGDHAPLPKEGAGTGTSRLSDIDFATGKPLDDGTEVAEKTSFYTRDPDLGHASFAPQKSGRYTGMERRKGGRRSGKERRNDIRFETDKEDRRQCHGRRKEDAPPDYW